MFSVSDEVTWQAMHHGTGAADRDTLQNRYIVVRQAARFCTMSPPDEPVGVAFLLLGRRPRHSPPTPDSSLETSSDDNHATDRKLTPHHFVTDNRGARADFCIAGYLHWPQ